MSDADMLARFKTSKKRPACSDTLGMDLAEVHQDEMRIVRTKLVRQVGWGHIFGSESYGVLMVFWRY
mgnify:CR=1 FL=1